MNWQTVKHFVHSGTGWNFQERLSVTCKQTSAVIIRFPSLTYFCFDLSMKAPGFFFSLHCYTVVRNSIDISCDVASTSPCNHGITQSETKPGETREEIWKCFPMQNWIILISEGSCSKKVRQTLLSEYLPSEKFLEQNILSSTNSCLIETKKKLFREAHVV